MELIAELGLLPSFVFLWLCPATFIVWYIMKILKNNQAGRFLKIVLIGILSLIGLITIIFIMFMVWHFFFNKWRHM